MYIRLDYSIKVIPLFDFFETALLTRSIKNLKSNFLLIRAFAAARASSSQILIGLAN